MALSRHMTQPARQPAPAQEPIRPVEPMTEEQIDQYLRDEFPERPVVSDPMRDKLPEDSMIWVCLMTESLHDTGLYHNLLQMRRTGTRIVETGGQLRLQPIIDPLNRVGWKSKNAYLVTVNECLKSKARQLTALLERAARLRKTLQQINERSGNSE